MASDELTPAHLARSAFLLRGANDLLELAVKPAWAEGPWYPAKEFDLIGSAVAKARNAELLSAALLSRIGASWGAMAKSDWTRSTRQALHSRLAAESEALFTKTESGSEQGILLAAIAMTSDIGRGASMEDVLVEEWDGLRQMLAPDIRVVERRNQGLAVARKRSLASQRRRQR